jgi:peptidoglycan/xylan/chitin deacetylase (PgdA/CDA1 family)
MRVLDRIRRDIERRRQARPGDAVVLAYHRLATLESDRWRLAVSPERFAEHVEVIHERFQPCSLGELAAALERGTTLRRAVAITFDDGYRDNLLAAKPILERHGVPATVFVVTGYTGTSGAFWWDGLERVARHNGFSRDEHDASWRRIRDLPHAERLREVETMQRDVGLEPERSSALTADEVVALADGPLVEIGAHTATHPALPSLAPDEQLREISTSRRYLEDLLGLPVKSFAYPHAEYDRTTVECVRRAGLQRACVVGNRAVTGRTALLEIPRVLAEDVPGDELSALLEARLRV